MKKIVRGLGEIKRARRLSKIEKEYIKELKDLVLLSFTE